MSLHTPHYLCYKVPPGTNVSNCRCSWEPARSDTAVTPAHSLASGPRTQRDPVYESMVHCFHDDDATQRLPRLVHCARLDWVIACQTASKPSWWQPHCHAAGAALSDAGNVLCCPGCLGSGLLLAAATAAASSSEVSCLKNFCWCAGGGLLSSSVAIILLCFCRQQQAQSMCGKCQSTGFASHHLPEDHQRPDFR